MRINAATAAYIEHNRNLGKRFNTEQAILAAFARALGDMPLERIKPAMIMRFLNGCRTSGATVRRKRMALAGFFRFAVSRHLMRSSPMPRSVGKNAPSSFMPYIYTQDELKRLLAAAPAATGPRADVDAVTLRMLVMLLYGAGLRRGEALRLTLDDVDVGQALIHVKGTKFFKTRIVPVSASLNRALRTFIAQNWQHEAGDGVVFCKRDGTPLTGSAAGAAFRRLREIADVGREGGARRQPRLHDLRHSAAVHRVTSWYRSGADLNDLLPKLATYLGHKDLSGTQRYLTMTEELLAEASRRFEAFARPSQGGEPQHD